MSFISGWRMKIPRHREFSRQAQAGQQKCEQILHIISLNGPDQGVTSTTVGKYFSNRP